VLYVDACAVVKRYVYEGDNGTAVVDALMRDPERWGGVVSSEWLILEVTSALTKKRRARVISRAGYRYLLGRFRDDMAAIGLISISGDVVRGAARLMETAPGARRFHSGDAIHLHTATDVSEGMIDPGAFVFVTTDEGLKATVDAAGLAVFDPRHQSIEDLERHFGR
jgi:predicted nucleic acid-binding protein